MHSLRPAHFPFPLLTTSVVGANQGHIPYTHTVQLHKTVVNLLQDSSQGHIVHRSPYTKWGRNGLLEPKRGPGDDGIQFCPGSTARWGETWNWQKLCGLLTGTASHCNCSDLCGMNAWFPFQRKPKCSTQQPPRISSLQMQHTEQMFCSETGHNLLKISFKSQKVFCGPHSGSLYWYS